jgi:hypothetical protein
VSEKFVIVGASLAGAIAAGSDEIIRLIEAGQPVDRERLTDATVPLTNVAAQPSSR